MGDHGKAPMNGRLFRYYREDFPEPQVAVLHMDLVFDVFDDHTRVRSDLTFMARTETGTLVLNARELEVISVSCPAFPLSYRADPAKNLMVLTFNEPVPAGKRVTITTETICRPTKNLLEGLYFDETPAGAPPQQITQCQQWGFQRLVPCIDDMAAKCTFSTTIIADKRYTHLISNGDVAAVRQDAGNGRDLIRYRNCTTPMAPYLFFLGCGTYNSFTREVRYPDGSRFALELLVPPGSDPAAAEQALRILHDCVLWIYLFTGPEMYETMELRRALYERMTGAGGPGTTGNKPGPAISPGYRYTGTVYREIGMQNSDYGGMENVGNTTITTNRIMPFPAMTDPSYEYMVKVKVHEYYHNLNGSEVTGRSPFELWLNEAVTVVVEDWYHAFHFGPAYSRLQSVLALVAPVAGTLAIDRGAASMPIEPDGFNDPNELVSDITYMKGPEFVRMIGTMIGKETFARGLGLYHARYRHGNASRADWIAAMEEVSGQSLAEMAGGWLRRPGYPTVSVTSSYDAGQGRVELRLHQSGYVDGKPWVFPLRIGFVDGTGMDTAEIVCRVGHEDETIVVPVPERPAFISLNRGFSFYGECISDAGVDEIFLQAEKDPDITSRCLAFLSLADREMTGLIGDPAREPSPRFVDLFMKTLSNTKLMSETGGQFLRIFDSVQDPAYAHRYQALWGARERILRRIAERSSQELLALYRNHALAGEGAGRGSLEEEAAAIKRRSVKNTCLSVLARLDTPEIHALLAEQLQWPGPATDRLAAFSLLLESSSPDRTRFLDAFLEESAKNPVSWEGFLSIIGSSGSADVVELVTRVESSDTFRVEQTNDQRALYGRFAMNRKRSLQTEEGRALLRQTISRLARINEFTTVGLLHAFDAIDRMEEEYRAPLVAILYELLGELDPEKTPSVYNTIRRILAGSPVAVARYESVRKHGPT